MKGEKVLYSSKSDHWETPQKLWEELDQEFHFDMDLAASKTNSKCIDREGEYENALEVNKFYNLMYWCNPPYSKCKEFVKLVYECKLRCVMLLPARTCTRWFHKYIYNKPDVEIRFIKGRLKFSNSKNSAPFPSMIVIFRRW